ncbi:MAG TPA: hypothetical protein VNN19_10370 [bacterium]|nr:hypothetical protein [bacterium]
MYSLFVSKIKNGYLIETIGGVGESDKAYAGTVEEIMEEIRRVLVGSATPQESASESPV